MPQHPGKHKKKDNLSKHRQSPRLQLPKRRWPLGNASLGAKNPSQKFDSTEHHRGEPTIP